jgi:hypothetical protein
MEIRNLKQILYLFLISIFFSCESTETVITQNNLLIGNWVEPVYNEEETTFTRSNSLPKEGSGISFNQSGNFVERTSGWCGTPPLTFFNINGTFEQQNPLIQISTNSYPTNYAWRIVSLTENKLVVKRELTQQEIEHRKLMGLFEEIQNLSYSKTCSNTANWTYAPYGSKACGGPQGYIPYSKKIDTISFLKKVDEYTKTEKEFNIKWRITSDCYIVNPPKSIECKNRFIILNY